MSYLISLVARKKEDGTYVALPMGAFEEMRWLINKDNINKIQKVNKIALMALNGNECIHTTEAQLKVAPCDNVLIISNEVDWHIMKDRSPIHNKSGKSNIDFLLSLI